MKRALAIRHLAFEDLGLIQPWLEAHGWLVETLDAGVDDLGAIALDSVDGLVVLGGPIGTCIGTGTRSTCLLASRALPPRHTARTRPSRWARRRWPFGFTWKSTRVASRSG